MNRAIDSWLAVSLLVFILATLFLLFRPGIVINDTLTRWKIVFVIAGRLDFNEQLMEQWLAPTMTICMLPIGLLGLSTELFTVFQIGYLMLAGSMWIAMTSSCRPFWIPLTLLVPLVFIYPNPASPKNRTTSPASYSRIL